MAKTEKEHRYRHQNILSVIEHHGMYSEDEIADWLNWYYKKRRKQDNGD